MTAEQKIKCLKCGEDLKPTQFARRTGDDGIIPKATDHLVCRNYPNCPESEKEVIKNS